MRLQPIVNFKVSHFFDHQRGDFPSLKPAALHGLVGDYVKLMSEYDDCDPTSLVAQLLVMSGNMMGHGPFVKHKGIQRLNLFVTLAARGTCMGLMGTSHNHVMAFCELIDKDWAEGNNLSPIPSDLEFAPERFRRDRSVVFQKGKLYQEPYSCISSERFEYVWFLVQFFK
jgi:hypothetical protein